MAYFGHFTNPAFCGGERVQYIFCKKISGKNLGVVVKSCKNGRSVGGGKGMIKFMRPAPAYQDGGDRVNPCPSKLCYNHHNPPNKLFIQCTETTAYMH
jgi:hypothetical protein